MAFACAEHERIFGSITQVWFAVLSLYRLAVAKLRQRPPAINEEDRILSWRRPIVSEAEARPHRQDQEMGALMLFLPCDGGGDTPSQSRIDCSPTLAGSCFAITKMLFRVAPA